MAGVGGAEATPELVMLKVELVWAALCVLRGSELEAARRLRIGATDTYLDSNRSIVAF